MVPRGVSHIFEIVMLSPGSNALLRRHRSLIGPLLYAEKRFLELIHARISK
jgi:hypothetical protein